MARRKAKKKTLPKDFEELLERGDLARWLVAEGADLSATDTWGNTPLHAAAERKHAEHAKQLLARGAKVDVRNKDGLTPLELALRSLANAELDRMPALVKVLLDAGASKTPAMKSHVQRIGESFEFHRENFNPERLPDADAALQFLYRTFEVTPVPRRVRHDGKSLIVVKETTWQKQHAELCDLLVPARGPAATLQGEVIRLSGKISDEWERDGGANWDRAFAAMARAFAGYVAQGTALGEDELDEIQSIVRSLSDENGRGNARLAELAVAWVLRNPRPLPLETPNYER